MTDKKGFVSRVVQHDSADTPPDPTQSRPSKEEAGYYLCVNYGQRSSGAAGVTPWLHWAQGVMGAPRG